MNNSIQQEFSFYETSNKSFSDLKVTKSYGFSLKSSDTDYYFGRHIVNQEDILLSYTMSVSEFVLANKCPKIFNYYFNKKSSANYPHHPLYFAIGRCFDSSARKYLSYAINTRPEIFSSLITKLKDEIEKTFKNFFQFNKENILLFKNWQEIYLTAFRKFCESFKHSNIVHSEVTKETLKIKLGKLNLSGKIDLLIEEGSHNYILLDLKLQKFGETDQPQFPDLIQILIYTIELINRGFELSEIGYYYFLDSMMLLEKVTDLKIKELKASLEKLANYLLFTEEFFAKKCELCLICPLKSNCAIGKSISIRDYKYPLI